MDKKKAKELRKRLDSTIIKLVAPRGMSVMEYKIQCNLNEFDATVENGMFLHWVMTAKDGDGTDVEDKVHDAIVNALDKKYLLDVDNKEQCAYFCDALKFVLLKDKEYSTRLLEGVLKGYKDSDGYGIEVFNFCKSLNKAFGFTSVEYFNYDGFKKALLSTREKSSK